MPSVWLREISRSAAGLLAQPVDGRRFDRCRMLLFCQLHQPCQPVRAISKASAGCLVCANRPSKRELDLERVLHLDPGLTVQLSLWSSSNTRKAAWEDAWQPQRRLFPAIEPDRVPVGRRSTQQRFSALLPCTIGNGADHSLLEPCSAITYSRFQQLYCPQSAGFQPDLRLASVPGRAIRRDLDWMTCSSPILNWLIQPIEIETFENMTSAVPQIALRFPFFTASVFECESRSCLPTSALSHDDTDKGFVTLIFVFSNYIGNRT